MNSFFPEFNLAQWFMFFPEHPKTIFDFFFCLHMNAQFSSTFTHGLASTACSTGAMILIQLHISFGGWKKQMQVT